MAEHPVAATPRQGSYAGRRPSKENSTSLLKFLTGLARQAGGSACPIAQNRML